MTLVDLILNVIVGTCTSGHFNVYVDVRDKTFYFTSTNTIAYDRIVHEHKNLRSRERGSGGFTLKQAFESLYKEYIKHKKENELRTL